MQGFITLFVIAAGGFLFAVGIWPAILRTIKFIVGAPEVVAEAEAITKSEV